MREQYFHEARKLILGTIVFFGAAALLAAIFDMPVVSCVISLCGVAGIIGYSLCVVGSAGEKD